MNMNYEWYRTFYTVVKEGGFSKAADKLCVTQPAVSQAIRRLEECAGVKLFVRRSGQPIPTEAGRRLFSFIERGVEWFASGENFLGRLSDPNAGEVTVGVSESACRFFILPHIKEMRQRFPDLKLKIKEGNTAQSLEALTRGEIDCALIMTPLNRLNASIRLTTLKSCRFGLYSSEIFTDIPEQPRPLKDYAACPFLMLDKRTETRKAADKFFTAHNIAVNVRIELSSVGLVKDFLKSGFGISMLLEDYVGEELENGSLIALPVKETMPRRDLALATCKEMPSTPAAASFFDFLQKRFSAAV